MEKDLEFKCKNKKLIMNNVLQYQDWMKINEHEESIFERKFSDTEREKLAKEGKALPDGSFPINSTRDLKNAIKAHGRAKDPDEAKAHIIKRAKDMGKQDLLPEEWK